MKFEEKITITAGVLHFFKGGKNNEMKELAPTYERNLECPIKDIRQQLISRGGRI